MKAVLSNYRQSPRKVRLVATLIKGKSVLNAREQLKFLPKRAAGPISKLLESAVANTGRATSESDKLTVSEVRVDAGATLKRSRPRARGSASRINKRTSHVQLFLK